MDEIKVNLENLTGEERAKLMALIEKANAPKSKVWKPELYEKYFFLTGKAGINVAQWHGGETEESAYGIGNVFALKEEAEEEVKRLQILTQWKRLSVEAGENENTWSNRHGHWSCYYSFETNDINYVSFTAKDENTFFPTEKSIRNAVKTIGEENVKKYILGVKGEIK